MSERAVNGDFNIIRLDGLFHVVFRPEADPEWFRIIASFYTYERAYSYCDIERVSVWTDDKYGPESQTGEEEVAGLRAPPIHLELPESPLASSDGIAELVRNVYDAGEHVEPLAPEDFSEQPNEDEAPKDYHDRQYADAISREADKPVCTGCGETRSPGSASLCRKCYRNSPADPDPQLTDNQRAVLAFFRTHANPLNLVNASYKQIATEAGVSGGSITFLVEALERKGFIEVVERGAPTRATVFRLTVEALTGEAA